MNVDRVNPPGSEASNPLVVLFLFVPLTVGDSSP